ncbi:rabenosyn-5-like [Dendronephthya gigantea]|uniref:rabenosyn-5-like n=1 Tax=Dendronephthya gigantea TaxID=151771 RepID=UPI00106CE938|nr:rabenosyn-5-like [Dendronephthya gigantea]
MEESNEVQEGFLCPLCMKDLRSQKLLETHFIDEHSLDDASKGQNIKGIFDKAKRIILGKGEEGLQPSGYEKKEELQVTTVENELDFFYWEPQEIGFTQDHTNEFRRARTRTINDDMIETNTILIRLQKILNALTDAQESNSLSNSKKKAKEKSMVPWKSDDDAKLCFGCKKTFTISRRKHHCRLCGQVICGKCSEFLPLSSAAIFCEMDGAQDVILSLDDNEASEKSALRICYQCHDLLLKNYEVERQKKKKIPLVQLYEKLTILMADADLLLPDFNRMAESLSFGDTRYTYQEVVTTRLKLLKMYESLEVVGKKVLALGYTTTTSEDGTTKTESPGKSSQKLHRGVHSYIANYLQNNMFTLKSIPSEEEYASLRQERAMLLKKRAEREKAQQEKAMKERAMMHKEVLRKARDSLPSSPAIRRHEMYAGQRRYSFDPEVNTLSEQINNVKDFLDKARENGQYDEVRSLERNLNELQIEYNKRIRR